MYQMVNDHTQKFGHMSFTEKDISSEIDLCLSSDDSENKLKKDSTTIVVKPWPLSSTLCLTDSESVACTFNISNQRIALSSPKRTRPVTTDPFSSSFHPSGSGVSANRAS
jgi:hypothetical protein